MKVMAIDSGIDTALEQAVVAFTRYQHGQLRTSIESQSRYLSFLSHDMRNNLNGVTLMLEVLRRRLEPLPDFAEDVEEISVLQRAVSDTINGMDQLLQAERLRRHAVEGKLARTELAHLVRDIAGPFELQAQRKRVGFVTDVPPDAVVNINRELVTLVLQNLLGNAVKYSTSGTVRVTAEPSPAPANETWIVTVSDEGPGISADELKKLFQAFQRGATHGEAGVGLGLSIASQAARLMGSELRVESDEGRGSRFWFTLPAAAIGAGDAPPSSMPTP
jgi:signal transduction histidine kinase